ncbi:MAG: sodium:solute symporter family protein, partial [Planctomycetota bacterium]
VLLLPLILSAIGGFAVMREKIADPEMFSLVAPGEIGIFYVAVIAFNALVGVMTQPQALSHCAAGKTEAEGRIGFMGGTLIKRFCTIPWCLTGVAAVVYFAGKDIHPDNVFGAVAGDFLPTLMPGVLGVFIAAVLAAVMSSCDAFMIASSALFTENVYRRLVCGEDDRHYITVGRIAAAAIVGGGVAFAFWLPDVVTGLEIFWKISPMMGIALWLGLFWRRTTPQGAWAATLTAFGIWFLTTKPYFIDFVGNIPGSEAMRFVLVKESGPEIYLPWQMLFYITGGTVAAIVVSLLTKPVPDEQLDNFYALVRTPIQPGEKEDAPCTLPEGIVVPEKRKLLPFKNLEILVPSLNSVIGFLVGWVCVAAIVYAVYLIASG